MSQLAILLSAFALSVITTMVLMPWLLSLCHKHELTDTTDDRYHFKVPRLGGMVFAPAILMGLTLSIILRLANESISDTLKQSSFLIMIGITLVYLLSIIDDIFGMKKWQKEAVIIVTSMALPLVGLYINDLHGLFGIYSIGHAQGFILTVVVTILTVKGLKAMNNLDGLAASISIIPLLTFGIIFYVTGKYSYATVAFSMAGTLMVFLYYNIFGDARVGTKVYMGHAGHTIMSYCVVYLSLKYAMDNPAVMYDHADAILLPYSLLALPVFEYVRVLAKSWWMGLTERQRIDSYIQHILNRKGFTQLQVVGIILVGDTIIIAMNMLLHHVLKIGITWIILMNVAVYVLLLILVSKKMEAPRHEPQIQTDFSGYKGEKGLVSIIMPTWNSSKFVGESIESILSQTYDRWELIITDDFSGDDTLEILRGYAKRDPRIIIQTSERNGGAGVSRNRSIATARGQYIAFCDSDDRWVPEKLEKQLEFMKSKDVVLCFSPYYTCDERGQYLGYISAPARVSLFQMMSDNKMGFLTCIYDTDFFGKQPMPKQRKRQDYTLLLRLLKSSRYAYSVQEPLAHYRLHSANLSSNKISLLKYNAQTYTEVFGWRKAGSYLFLFTVFLPSYFMKRVKNILINVVRAA